MAFLARPAFAQLALVISIAAGAEDANAQLGPVPRALTQCTRDSDCVATFRGCCPPCMFGYGARYQVAINRRADDRFRRWSCGLGMGSHLNGPSCPACAGSPGRVEVRCVARACRVSDP